MHKSVRPQLRFRLSNDCPLTVEAQMGSVAAGDLERLTQQELKRRLRRQSTWPAVKPWGEAQRDAHPRTNDVADSKACKLILSIAK